MDEIDEESFRRGPGGFNPGAASARGGTGRRETRRGTDGTGLRVEVEGLDPDSRRRIREELQLLAALEVAGISAAPGVLEIEEDGYLREAAPPLHHRSGRRAAEGGAPPTGERLALARARDDLDDLIEALHQRGWVLGAEPGLGLGVRADGSVVALDLDGLQRGETLSARQGDRRWVDSVLEDQERTLRRRIDQVAPSWPVRESSLREPEPAAEERERAAPAEAEQEPEVGGVEPAEGHREEKQAGPALPSPRRIRRRKEAERATEHAHEHPALLPSAVPAGVWSRGLSAIRQVLGQPPLRRVAVGSALVVLLLGSTAAVGAWWASERPAQAPDHEQPLAQTSASSREVPQIEDPWVLVADVAGARHAYVTGVSEQPAAVPGSEAFTADEQTRLAYRSYQVHGGGPVVHEAELLEGPDGEDTAVLRAVTSTTEHQLEDQAGTLTDIPATVPQEVRLTLRWDGERWLIETADVVTPAADGDGAS
ncbi:hypothetical protein [Brachybacterium paraconglomeratum]|uniref:hypothetical protein n=1 Tax=Brachybacterium paraconglomeratum TaxID=173362 RepID=UPI0031ED019D